MELAAQTEIEAEKLKYQPPLNYNGPAGFRRNEDTFRSKQGLVGWPLKKPPTVPNGKHIASFVSNVVEGLFGGRQLAAA